MTNWQGLPVIVLGMGISGEGAAKLLLSLSAKIFLVSRGEPHTWKLGFQISNGPLNEHCFSDKSENYEVLVSKAKLLIISPGVPSNHPLVLLAKNKGIKIWSEIELAYQVLKESAKVLPPIIALTGSNGKTTTVSLIAAMLVKKANGDKRKVFLGGNYGVAFSDLARNVLNGEKLPDYIVLELSSFQLENIQDSHADRAIILNLSFTHAERYQTPDDYFQAKINLLNNMTKDDVVFYPFNERLVTLKLIYLETQTRDISGEKALRILPQKYSLKNWALPGNHNLFNLYAAELVANSLDVETELIQQVIDEFQPPHHRIERVNVDLPYRVINDSKSTNMASVFTALKSFPESSLVLMMGGKLRSANDSLRSYAEKLNDFNIRKIIFFGEAGPKFYSELKDINPKYDLELITEWDQLPKSIPANFQGVVLFSPGLPSFDQFRDYEDRGDKFKSLWMKRQN